MRTCKGILSKGTAAFALLFAFDSLCFSQSAAPAAPTPPSAPSISSPAPVAPGISMPSMPRISAPVAGSSFYTPGKNFLRKNEKSGVKTIQSQTKESVASKDLENSLLGNEGLDFSNLTAQDLVQMAKSGSLTNVSSLLGNATFNGSNASNNSPNNQLLLKQILSELKEIKETQASSLTAAQTGTKPSSLPPKILRFVVNANDVLSKCVQVYFSDRENDGSFLLTGDAKSLFENQNISETFYILFKACGTKNSKTIYTVTPSLSQSQECPSPLSKFCGQNSLQASRVGNLVTLHTIQNGNVCDLLLDIGSAQ